MKQKVNLWHPGGLLEIKTHDPIILIKHMGWNESREYSTPSTTFEYDGSLVKPRRVGSPETVRYFVGIAMREKWGAYLSDGLFIAPPYIGEKGVPFFEECEGWKVRNLKSVTLKLSTRSENWYKSLNQMEEEEAMSWSQGFKDILKVR